MHGMYLFCEHVNWRYPLRPDGRTGGLKKKAAGPSTRGFENVKSEISPAGGSLFYPCGRNNIF
jgi:hypothetical protein